MSDQTAILIVITLAAIFFGLWIYSGKQKRRFEDERRKRKIELDRLKTNAKAKKRARR